MKKECPVLLVGGGWKEDPKHGSAAPPESFGEGVFVNRNSVSDTGMEILRIISEARQTIEMMNPLVTDGRIVDALVAARERGVRIKIITEIRENSGKGVKYPTRGFDATDPSVDPSVLKEHHETIRLLTRKGVRCRGLSHCAHGKLVLADRGNTARQMMMISSVNLTGNSLGWGKSFSLEAGVGSSSPDDVAALGGMFSALWDACHFQMHVKDGDISIQEGGARPLDPNQLEKSGETSHFCWSFPPSHFGIRNQLAALCDSATCRIIFAAMSFYDTQCIPQLHGAIERALARGVKVTAVVRPEQFKEDKYPDASTRDLICKGMTLVGHTGLHAKGVLVDSSDAAVFSANINPFSLEGTTDSAHVECAMFGQFDVSESLRGYGKFIEWLAENPTHRYVM